MPMDDIIYRHNTENIKGNAGISTTLSFIIVGNPHREEIIPTIMNYNLCITNYLACTARTGNPMRRSLP